MKRIKEGSIVILPNGRVGLWTSTAEGIALVMSGNDKFFAPSSELTPAFDL